MRGWSFPLGRWMGVELRIHTFFILLLVETDRMPIHSSTHIEVYMIDEGRILEYSGPLLALLKWASAMKQFILYTIFCNVLILPWGLSIDGTALGAFGAAAGLIVKFTLVACVVVFVETAQSRLRFYRYQEPLAAFDLVAFGVDDKAVRAVAVENAAHIADVVQHAGDEEMGVIAGIGRRQQRAALHDVVADQRHQHGVFDIMVERVAIADAFQRDLRHERNDFREARMRAPEPILHVGGKERAQRFRRQFWQSDHGSLSTKEPTIERRF